MREPRDILLPELLSLSLSTLSGEVRDEEKLESRAEEKAPELRLLRPPYPLSLNIELEAVLEWNGMITMIDLISKLLTCSSSWMMSWSPHTWEWRRRTPRSSWSLTAWHY